MNLASPHLDKEHPGPDLENRPWLAIDVDGVISLFGFDSPPPPGAARWELIDGTPHCLSIAAAERIQRLSGRFNMVWATGWQERANDRLSLLTGIGPLPVIEFDAHRDPVAASSANQPAPATGEPGAAAGTTAAHWKLGALTKFCKGRALAWIDDSFDASCLEWADSREAAGIPTLLVPTEPDIGFEEAQAEVLAQWADSLLANCDPAASGNDQPAD